MTESTNIREGVKDYYGEVLSDQKDLKTSACCSIDSIPRYQREVLRQIDKEVLRRFYGCGSPIPLNVDGLKVLDLGCGTGRDVYLLSKLVGPNGRVLGVDMTARQLEVAKRHQERQMKVFGYSEPNVEFHHGHIEDLNVLGLQDESLDLVVSNCVINLSTDKERVLQEVHRVLKEGGELFFSDIFVDRRLPEEMQHDKVLMGECLGGALYLEDFRRMMEGVGFPDPRIVKRSPIEIQDEDIRHALGPARFESITYRVFKSSDLEDRCEDYGQVATYRGGMEHSPHVFELDDHHLFEAGRPMLVCGNTATMVSQTRFAPFFDVQGDRTRHFGLFDCGPVAQTASKGSEGSCC